MTGWKSAGSFTNCVLSQWKILTSILKASLMGADKSPTFGLLATLRFSLAAIFVYQLVVLYHLEHDLELRVGLKAFLEAA